jgi:D-3-phosphoglycerate dehydrogenase / 2-oxoglutarate reductase
MIQKNWVLILDFDSTLITIESLDLLAKICCKGNKSSDLIIKKIKNLTSLGMEGKINFQDSLRKRLEYLQIEDYHLNQLDIELKYFISPSIKKNKFG